MLSTQKRPNRKRLTVRMRTPHLRSLGVALQLPMTRPRASLEVRLRVVDASVSVSFTILTKRLGQRLPGFSAAV